MILVVHTSELIPGTNFRTFGLFFRSELRLPGMAGSNPRFINVPARTHIEALGLDEEWGTPRMRALAEQLRTYKAPSLSFEYPSSPGVNSSVGVPESQAIGVPWTKRAAVLICLYQDSDEEIRVILTRRASTLSSHSGEVSFPGGKKDPEDVDDVATALREAYEEIGLDPSHVRSVTLLEPVLSKHLLRVTPVIAILPDKHKFQPVRNEAEVDAIFDAPLEMFLKDKDHRTEDRLWLGLPYRIHYFDYCFGGEHYKIWGLTAGLLIRAASLVFQKEPEFEDPAIPFESIARNYLNMQNI